MVRKLARSLSAIFTSQVINVLGQVSLVPLFLSFWSSNMYGEWLALSAVVTYLATMDLGMNSASRNALLAAASQSDLEKYTRIQSATFTFYIPMAVGATILAVAATQLFPVGRLLRVVEMPSSTASWVVVVLTARIMWSMPTAQIWNIYRNTGDLAMTQWVWNFQALGAIAATVIVLLAGGGPLQVAIWASAPIFIAGGACWLALRRSHRAYLPKLRIAGTSAVREVLTPSLYFALIMLAMAASVHGPVLLVSRALGGTAVALLVTTRTVANVVRQLVQMLVEAVWPEMTSLDAAGERGKLRLTHRLLIATSTSACAAAAAALWFEGGSIIQIWTRGRLVPDINLLRAFLACTYLQSPWIASSTVVMSNNRHFKLASSYLTAALVTLVVAAVLVPAAGLIAVPIAIVSGEAIACYHFVIRQSCREIGEPYKPFAAGLWCGVLGVGGAALACGWLAHELVAGATAGRFFVVGIATVAGAVPAAWHLMLRVGDRAAIAGVLANRWPRPAALLAPPASISGYDKQ